MNFTISIHYHLFAFSFHSKTVKIMQKYVINFALILSFSCVMFFLLWKSVNLVFLLK